MQLVFPKNTLIFILALSLCFCFSCGSQNSSEEKEKSASTSEKVQAKTSEITTPLSTKIEGSIVMGADQFSAYEALISEKKIAIVANPTSIVSKPIDSEIANVHLVDFLHQRSFNIQKVFSPEHGFRGTADAGESVKDGMDQKTGIPILSLHGKNKKPTPEQMDGLEMVIFDIQDVGVRFYTYISTMHHVMEACAEAGIPLIILDRPNPNGHYIDGPMMEEEHTSFLGMHPVPLVHGMTIGEYLSLIHI